MEFLGKVRTLVPALAALALANGAGAQTFFQSFDSLPDVGATSGWTDNLTVPANGPDSWTNNGSNSLTGFSALVTNSGVPASPALIRISDGSSGFGNSGLYSFGSAASSERALGGFTGFQNGQAISEVAYGFRYTNNTGAVVDQVRLDYRLEQWRSSAGGITDRLQLEYLIDRANNQNLGSAGYLTRSTVLAYPPTGNVSVAQDGNVAGNFVNHTGIDISGLNLAAGESLWIRWRDQRLSSTGANEDGGLSIDNLTFTVTAVPEPSSLALLGLAGLGVAAWRRRKPAA